MNLLMLQKHGCFPAADGCGVNKNVVKKGTVHKSTVFVNNFQAIYSSRFFTLSGI